MLDQAPQPSFNLAPLLALPVLLPLVLLQGTLFGYVPVGGVIVQVAVVAVLAVALWRDSAESVIWAFVAGILLDLNSIAPLGGSAFALCLAVLVIGPFRANLTYNRVILPLLLAGGAMLVYQLLTVLILRLGGVTLNEGWTSLLPARIIVHALLTVPVYWLLRTTNLFSRRPSQINL